jgi:hypothetical protein
MSDPIISIERIRKAAEEAVLAGKPIEDCPPEFEGYRHTWMHQYKVVAFELASA